MLTWSMRGAAICTVIALAIGFWKFDEMKRLWAVNTLFSKDLIVQNFSNMHKAFLWTELDRGDALPDPLQSDTPINLTADTRDWIIARDVTSLVILKDGKLRFEQYYLGTKPQDRRIGWSISKSMLSALIGIAVAEGAIASLDDPVTDYVPALSATAYDGTSIRDVMTMTSGVAFNEDYHDHDSDINKMGRVLALGRHMDAFVSGLTERVSSPGEQWRYVSIDTHIAGMVLRSATGRSLSDYMSERLIAPINMSAQPYYLTDGAGVAFALGGINMTTRDYARFGQLYLQEGTWQGRQLVPYEWVAASTTPSAPTEIGQMGYGYQWWIPTGAEPGEFMARGIYGQYIYVNRPAGVVIATTAADLAFREAGVSDQNVAIFRQIATQLQTIDEG